jgi:hypothetical protein
MCQHGFDAAPLDELEAHRFVGASWLEPNGDPVATQARPIDASVLVSSDLGLERCRVELSAGEILGEPDDQVVVHAHLHAFADRPLALTCAPAVGDLTALSVHPLGRAVLVEQADSNA